MNPRTGNYLLIANCVETKLLLSSLLGFVVLLLLFGLVALVLALLELVHDVLVNVEADDVAQVLEQLLLEVLEGVAQVVHLLDQVVHVLVVLLRLDARLQHLAVELEGR